MRSCGTPDVNRTGTSTQVSKGLATANKAALVTGAQPGGGAETKGSAGTNDSLSGMGHFLTNGLPILTRAFNFQVEIKLSDSSWCSPHPAVRGSTESHGQNLDQTTAGR